MPRWTKQTSAPSFYGWVPIADLRAALPAILARLQAGGVAKTEPGPGGVDEDGVELPGEPKPWAHPNLTAKKLKRWFRRQTSETKDGHALMEIEFHHLVKFPPAFRQLFGTAAEFHADPKSADRRNSDNGAAELADFGAPLDATSEMG